MTKPLAVEFKKMPDGRLVIITPPMSDSGTKVVSVMVRAIEMFVERNGEREDAWKRSGLKGQCFMLQAKADRAFSAVMGGRHVSQDHFIDAIVYSAFAYILNREHNTDGIWPWNG